MEEPTHTLDRSRKGAQALVHNCANLQKNERVLILVDSQTSAVGDLVASVAREFTKRLIIRELPAMSMHGMEPDKETAVAMKSSDLIFCLTTMSLAHSQARRAATDAGARYLSLPDYSLSVLSSPAILADFRSISSTCHELGEKIDQSTSIKVTSPLGTDISFSTKGRQSNRCPGFVDQPGTLGSPPDAEVNIAPVEGSGAGKIVVDGSVPCAEVGLLSSPIELVVENGMVIKVSSNNRYAKIIEAMFDSVGTQSRNLGEFGIGLNPLAKLTGVMLEDEGCLGTVHFGIGANNTIGGTVGVPFHLDFIFKDASIRLDNVEIMKHGVLV